MLRLSTCLTCLQRFEQGMQMFPPGMHTQGALAWVRAIEVPKKEKWARMLPAMELQIADKVGAGRDVAFLDGSRDSHGGG